MFIHRLSAALFAGPAGVTAAIYAARAGLKPVVVSPPTGGQLMSKGVNVENYPGIYEASGGDIIKLMKKQARRDHQPRPLHLESQLQTHESKPALPPFRPFALPSSHLSTHQSSSPPTHPPARLSHTPAPHMPVSYSPSPRPPSLPPARTLERTAYSVGAKVQRNLR